MLMPHPKWRSLAASSALGGCAWGGAVIVGAIVALSFNAPPWTFLIFLIATSCLLIYYAVSVGRRARERDKASPSYDGEDGGSNRPHKT
jgi:threonine/homoserine/homoserine lactone efflux protein